MHITVGFCYKKNICTINQITYSQINILKIYYASVTIKHITECHRLILTHVCFYLYIVLIGHKVSRLIMKGISICHYAVLQHGCKNVRKLWWLLSLFITLKNVKRYLSRYLFFLYFIYTKCSATRGPQSVYIILRLF